jgi:hypothetical protein
VKAFGNVLVDIGQVDQLLTHSLFQLVLLIRSRVRLAVVVVVAVGRCASISRV